MRNLLKNALVIFVVMFAVHVTVVSCDAPPSQATMTAAHQEALSVIAHAEAEIARLERIPDLTPDEAAELARYKAIVGEVKTAVEGMADPETGEFDWANSITTLAGFIPPPWNVPVSLFGGALATWWGGRKTRNSFGSLVDAINKAKAKLPEFAKALDAAGPTIKEAMGPTATAVVDKLRTNGGHAPRI